LNQQGQDLLMQAPSLIENDRLKELHVRVQLPPQKIIVKNEN